MPRASKEQKTARAIAFKELEVRHGFTPYALMSYASSLRVSWVREQVLSQEAQVLGRTAFRASADWHYGQRGRPRFKSVRRGIRSLSGKDLCGSLRPKLVDGVLASFQFGAHTQIKFAPAASQGRKGREQQENWAALTGHVAGGRVLSCRIVKTVISGRPTYRAQFTIDGLPPARHEIGSAKVSIDLGPSQVAVAVLDTAGTTNVHEWKLADGIDMQTKALRRLQRRFDRQHRAGSPTCFNADGTHVKNRCDWKQRSHRALATAVQIADAHRKTAGHRLTLHGTMVNNILRHGGQVSAEKLNYVSWQKNFPRSVRDRAPGLFMEILRRKAGSADDSGLYEYSAWTTALSQTCVCGNRKRKHLSERVHTCDCGVRVGRDRMSAYLGLFVSPVHNPGTDETVDLLDLGQAQTHWARRNDISGRLSSEPPTKRQGSRRHKRQLAGPIAPSIAATGTRQSRSARTIAHHPPMAPPPAGRQ